MTLSCRTVGVQSLTGTQRRWRSCWFYFSSLIGGGGQWNTPESPHLENNKKTASTCRVHEGLRLQNQTATHDGFRLTYEAQRGVFEKSNISAGVLTWHQSGWWKSKWHFPARKREGVTELPENITPKEMVWGCTVHPHRSPGLLACARGRGCGCPSPRHLPPGMIVGAICKSVNGWVLPAQPLIHHVKPFFLPTGFPTSSIHHVELPDM